MYGRFHIQVTWPIKVIKGHSLWIHDKLIFWVQIYIVPEFSNNEQMVSSWEFQEAEIKITQTKAY
jgi:hypothetical protein